MPPRNSRWKAAKKARDCKAAKAALKRSEAKDEASQDHPDAPKTIAKKSNESTSFVKANPPCVVLSTLFSGSTYQATRTILLMNGVKPCSRATFYTYQAEIGPKIVSLAKKSCQEAMMQSVSQGNYQFSQDSRWSSPRHGKENTNAMIDLKTSKVVSYYDTINDRNGKNPFGNFSGASNMMESNGLHHIASEMRENFGDKALDIVHDGDNKSANIYTQEGLNVNHYRDFGHAKKSLRNAFTSVRRELNYISKNEQPFYGVVEKMIQFAKFIVNVIDDPNLREELWMNSPNHLTGDHSHCIHPSEIKRRGRPRKINKSCFNIWDRGVKNLNYKHALERYCEKTVPIIRACCKGMATTVNESLNASIGTFSPKRVDLKSSYQYRSALAIGKKNDPEFIKKVFESVFKTNQLPDFIYSAILDLEEQNNIEKEKRNQLLERIRTTNAKNAAKKRALPYEEGDYNEKKDSYEF